MIKVLIVDDSASVRRVLSRSLSEFSDIEVIGMAPNAAVADQMVLAQKPDVMTLDVEMPGINGLTFLERLLRREPVAVVVISSVTARGSNEALRALEIGAVEVLAKPNAAEAADFPGVLVRAIRAAAHAKVRQSYSAPVSRPESKASGERARPGGTFSRQVLAIGASAGGTEAIRHLMRHQKPDTPAILIAQHLPPGFTLSFAQRLDAEGPVRVCEAKGGEELLTGHAYVAPGGFHLQVHRNNGRYVLELDSGPREHFQRPAIDVLFRSVAKAAGGLAVGVLLTGMGQDGALGLLEIRRSGGRTFAQDEASSVVYGMPKAAVEKGAVECSLHLDHIPAQIQLAFQRMTSDSPSGKIMGLV